MGTSSVSTEIETAPPAERPAGPGAVRGGALLLAAMAVSIGGTYLFYLASGRVLGPSDYGELATLIALVTLASLPFTAVQNALSRDVSGLIARGEPVEADRLVGATLRAGAIATAALVALFLVLMVPLADLLHLGSVGQIGLAVVAIAPAVLFPILLGDLQGLQQFPRLAIGTAAPAVIRLVLFGIAVAVGWRLYGALAAMAIAAFLGLAAPAWWRRDLGHSLRAARDVPIRPFLVALVPVLVAILGVTALTNVDLLLVKARLTSEDAGIYGAAGAFAKVGFFLPSAIVAVVFPRVAARRATGRETEDILGRILLVTAGFCVLLFLLYAGIGTPAVRLTYGEKFAEAGDLLWLFGLGMTCFSLANVLASYHLSRHDNRFAWLIAAAAVCQPIALALVPGHLRTFLWANAGIGLALLVAHEVVMGSSARAVRAGLAHWWDEIVPQLRLRARLAAMRRPLAEAIAVLVASTGISTLLTWPLLAHLGDRTLGAGGDVFGTIADFWRQATYTGYHVTGTSQIWNTGAPFGWEQGNGVNIQSSLIYYPAYLLTKAFGEIPAYDLAAFSGLVLSGAAMYWLVKRLTGSILVAAWAGFVFTIFPWHMAKAEAHGSLAHLEGFPLLVLALLAWYRRPGALSLLYLGGAMAILWLTSGYFGVIALVALLVLLPLTAWFHRRRYGLGGAAGRLVLAGGSVLFVALVVYGIARLGTASGEISPERQVSDLAIFGARLWEFFVPAWDSVTFGDLTRSYLSFHLHLSNFSESSLYVGWLTLALALGYVVWCILRRHGITEERRFLCAAFSAMVAVSVVFMPPYPVTLGDVRIPTATWLLWKVIPQFRVPTRFMALLMTGLVPLAALALALLKSKLEARVRLTRRHAAAGALVVLAAGLSYMELATAPPAELVRIGVPPEYHLVEKAPEGILVEYPMGGAGEAFNSNYVFWQRWHRRALVNGAPEGTFPEAIRQVVSDPSEPGVAGGLATLGVTAIVNRPGEYPFPTSPLRLPRDPGPGYELVGTTPSGVGVWRVVAEPSPLAVFTSGFSFSEKAPNWPLARWMIAPRGTVELVVDKAGQYTLSFTAASYGQPRRLVIEGAGSSWAIELPDTQAAFQIPVDLPRGRSVFTLTVDPGPVPAPGADPRELAVFMSNWVFEPRDEASPAAVRPVLVNPQPVPDNPLA
jgi:O-antigen/teichoic acid export membrane protein